MRERSFELELSGYVLETLHESSEHVLSRGRRPGDAVPILVLAPSPAPASQASASRRRIEHEYALARELDPAWAVAPRTLARLDGRTVLVLDDTGRDPLARMLRIRRLELPRFLRVAISLARAIRQVHQHGLIHKHITTGHVLVDAAGDVRLTGFGIASRLPRERQAPAPPEVIAGTLAYMAPEQTGRMNQSIDARSDLYSLGIVFYEMLTGTLPFAASDPMEWIHCHIARRPAPPREQVPDLPGAVEDIVLKLLAKTAEDRYQTAAGVEADLERCLAAWERDGGIAPFALGAHDVSGHLLIPERLYGREAAIDALVAAFDRAVTAGTTECVLLSGPAGIGKTSVVNELQKHLVPRHGFFAGGKFDQYQRDIPYATLAQAFQHLVRSLLGKSDAELRPWREQLLEALRPNGQLMVNLIPELALIIGPQPPVADLGPQDAQNRFLITFRRFLGVFARPDHPLVIFLDDMQWLDAATIDLLASFVKEPDLGHLLLICAYRDNDVGPAHPLMRLRATVAEAGGEPRELQLGPLTIDDVRRLVAEALHAEPDRVDSLAALMFAKTGGNPFFTVQFLNTLADERLIVFDRALAAWQWDLDRIRAKSVTDNVVDLMTGRLSRFAGDTLEAVKQLACLGNSATVATLGGVLGATDEQTHQQLWEAERAGLVLRLDGVYAFVHDRVHEAAYALIPVADRAEAHRRIARRLVAARPDAEIDQHIFEIVSQFTRGDIVDTDQAEREQIAVLNMRAGRRAKASSAYVAAAGYLAAGAALLGAEGWTRCYDLTFAVTLEQAECTFLNSEFDAADRLIATLLWQSKTKAQMAIVYRLKIELLVVRSENPGAIASGLACLRLFGIETQPHPSQDEVQREYDDIWRRVGDRSIEQLAALPPMDDPDMQAAMRVLGELIAPAYFTDFNLMAVVICRMVNLSLTHGRTEATAQGYAWLGWLLGPAFGCYEDGYRFGTFACDLVMTGHQLLTLSRVHHTMGLTSSWTQPLTTSIEWFRSALRSGIEAGDLYFASYSCGHIAISLLMRGDHLREAADECQRYIEFARTTGFRDGVDLIRSTDRAIASLRGLTVHLSSFSDAEFDEVEFEAHLTPDRMSTSVYWYWTRKAMVHYLSGHYQAALASAEQAQPARFIETVQIQNLDYHYYSALSLAALADTASTAAPAGTPAGTHGPLSSGEGVGGEVVFVAPAGIATLRGQDYRARLAAHAEQIREWATQSRSPTFVDKDALVSAEIARLDGRDLDAERLYEEAIRAAREHGFVQHEGVANEVAARFYAARGFTTIAEAYLRQARACFVRWGADGKVRQLDRAYPQLREERASTRAPSTIGTLIEHLDLDTVVKVSQAISSEIDFERLIDTLIVIAIEHAGADRGLLILRRRDELWIEAEAVTTRERVAVQVRRARVVPADLPESVLRYAVRTQGAVLLADTAEQNQFSDDAYIREGRCRSVLCLPLVKQARLVGLLYLENSQAPHVFTPARMGVLTLLASQAAISLENAQLYADLQRARAHLAEAQRLTHTGSTIFDVASGQSVWSDEIFRIYELDPVPVVPMDLVMPRVHPEDRDRIRQEIADMPRDGRDHEFEHRLLMPDGRVKTLQIITRAVTDELGELTLVATAVDVTAARLAQEALNRAQADLAHVARLTTLGEMAASIAHEVNQPLAAIVTTGEANLRWLARTPPELDRVRVGLKRISDDARRASDVIKRIRALARKADPERVRLDLPEVIDEVIKLAQHEIVSNRVSLRLDVANELPAVFGDRIHLQQVIINLVVNGIQAMAKIDDRPRTLAIRAQRHDDAEVLVAVQDSGHGIDPDQASRLFEAFFSTKPNGMGMGLSICRSIIDTHGGRIWGTSPGPGSDAGAVFQFTLPAIRDGDALA